MLKGNFKEVKNPLKYFLALDRDYSQVVKLKLSELRPRLRRGVLLTLDNENLDCGDERMISNTHRCSDYPLTKSFHYVIVEDS